MQSNTFVLGQNCNFSPTGATDIDVNGVRARIYNAGDLWNSNSGIAYEVTSDLGSPNVNPVGSVYYGGLWLMGLNEDNEIAGAISTPIRGRGRYDYYPGPLNEDGTPFAECGEWDKFFRIRRNEVLDLRNAQNQGVVDTASIAQNILGWPAKGNPFFTDVHGIELPDTEQGLAPFWDNDNDGNYDPIAGDYPAFCGDEAIWCVFNSSPDNRYSGVENTLQTEVHLLVYALAAPDNSPLHRTTFYDYKIINRGTGDISELYAGINVNFDLGCYTDDYLGSNPERNLVFTYNEEREDTSPCESNVADYGDTAPIQMAQIVATNSGEEQFLSSAVTTYLGFFGGFPAEMSYPETAEQYYSVMRGNWRDGTPIRRQGAGYQTGGEITKYSFDGEPSPNGNAWLNCINDTNPRLLEGQVTMSTGSYNLAPGEVATFSLAMTTIFNVEYPTGICPDFSPAFVAADSVKAFYDRSCQRSFLTNIDEPQAEINTIEIVAYPNPTNNNITFELPTEEMISGVEIFDVEGRLLATIPATGNSHTIALKEVTCKSGVYLYRVQTSSGQIVTGRLLLFE